MDRKKFIEEAGNLDLVIANRVRETKIVPAIIVVVLCKLIHSGLSIAFAPEVLKQDSSMMLNTGAVSLIMTLVTAYIIWVLSQAYRMQPMTVLKIGKRMHTLALLTLIVGLLSFVLVAYTIMNMDAVLALQKHPEAFLTNQPALIVTGMSIVVGGISLVSLIYGIMVLVDLVNFKLPLYKPVLAVLVGGILIGITIGAISTGASIGNPDPSTNPVVIMATQAGVVLNLLLSLYLFYSLYRVVTTK